MTKSLTLPANLDSEASVMVRTELVQALQAGQALTADASAVERIGTPGLQLLFAARRDFAAAGLSFCLASPSPVLSQAAGDLSLECILETGDTF